MFEVLLIGIVIGMCLVGAPLIINLFSQNKQKEKVEQIQVDIEEIKDEYVLDDNEYKISAKPNNEIEDAMVQYLRNKIREQHIVGANKDLLIKDIQMNPDEWVVIFEVSGE